MSWRVEQIFLTVKAYPTISRTHHEACCMAGITRAGQWIRLYPVPFRELEADQQFSKYTWIEAKVQKSKDFRTESHIVDSASIKKLETLGTKNGWLERNKLLLPLVLPAAQVFRDDRDLKKNSLGLIEVTKVLDLEIEEVRDEDYKKQLSNLNRVQSQLSLLPAKDLTPLEVIPFSFRYRFLDDAGVERNLKVVDWEIYQLHRNVKHKKDWRKLIEQKYVTDFHAKYLHLFVGTVHAHPQVWLAIGVYYPPKPSAIAHNVEQLGLDLR